MEKSIFGFICGSLFGAAIYATTHDPTPVVDRKDVLECMSDVGWDAADPSATRNEQLYQAQRWCEQFLEGPARTSSAI